MQVWRKRGKRWWLLEVNENDEVTNAFVSIHKDGHGCWEAVVDGETDRDKPINDESLQACMQRSEARLRRLRNANYRRDSETEVRDRVFKG